jgi:hypothetical protein
LLIRSLLALLILTAAALPAAAAPTTVTPLPPVNSADPFFGSVQAVYAADAGQRAGVKWERLVFWWSKMQPNGPGDNLRDSWFTDAEIDREVARGFMPIGVVLSTPGWAARDSAAGSISVPKNLDLPATSPENYWAQYWAKLAAKYRGRIDTWIVWNEPDMYRGNERRTWSGGVDDYYKLLRAAYLGAKSTNPNARIFVSGMTYWWDKENGRRQFLDELLERIAADPAARANNYYFDGVSVHSYANPLNSFAIPTIFRGFMRTRGIDKPIWIQESNVVPKDDPVQPNNGPFRASLDEQASYVIQSMALARAAGVERAAIYKMNDTGGENGELYGLVRDDGSARPSYVAYQVAATYFSNVRSATYSWSGAEPPSAGQIDALLRSNEGRFQFVWPGAVNKVVMDRGSSRVTVVWNASPQRTTARVPATAGRARLVDKLGVARDITPTDGGYQLDLEPSTNNSDPRDQSAYLVGGSPWILVEETGGAPPPAAVAATPTPAPAVAAPVAAPAGGVDARIQIVFPHNGASVTQAERANVSVYLFQSGGRVPVACDYAPTVRLWAGLNNDPARPIGTATRRLDSSGGRSLPAYDFNDVDVSAARNPRNKLYFFVSIDGQANRSTVWSHGADARTFFPAPDTPTGVGAVSQADAKVEIVWPHGNAPVDRAQKVNVTATLFQRGTLQAGTEALNPTVRLYRSLNAEPAEQVGTGARRMVQAGGVSYPVWDFNDVDVAAANDPGNKYYFWVTADGLETNPNVWSHGADARTYFPQKDVPTESCR